MLLFSGFSAEANEDVAGIKVLGLDWSGKAIFCKRIVESKLEENKFPNEMINEWEKRCSWYELIGGSGPIHKIKLQRDNIVREISKLRLEPQSTEVMERVRTLNQEVKLLDDQSRFLQAGFVKRPALYYKNGAPFDISAEIPIEDLSKSDVLVEIRPERIGLGSGVHLWVSCYRKDEPSAGKLDEFQAFFPCVLHGHERNDSALHWPGPEYTDMTIGDLAAVLQLVYQDRNADYYPISQPILRLCGRWLSAPERAPDVFKSFSNDELYSEKIDLFVDVENEEGLRPRSMLELSRWRLQQKALPAKKKLRAITAILH